MKFKYKGFTFHPERNFTKDENKDLRTITKHIKSDKNLGICNYDVDWKKHSYNYKEFYNAMKNSEFDLFRCVDNGKLYVPGEHELFEFIE